MFRQKPVLPVELQIHAFPSSSAEESFVNAGHLQFKRKVQIMKEIHQRVNTKALKSISNAQQRMKKNCDTKHHPPSFKTGYQVSLKLVRNDSRKRGKLECSWTGPYILLECLPNELYEFVKDGKQSNKSYNGAQLKKYLKSREKDADKGVQNPIVWLPEL